MSEKARTDLKSLLEDMAALSPWSDVGDPTAQPFIAAFTAARARALAAAPAYVAAVKTSPDNELKSWLEDMAALKRWTAFGDAEHEPFNAAFSAARARALAAAVAANKP